MCNGPPPSMDSVTRWAARTVEPSTPAFFRYGTVNHCCGSGSVGSIPMFLFLPDPDPLVIGTEPESFCHQAKIVRKTLIPSTVVNDFNVPSKSNKQRNFF